MKRTGSSDSSHTLAETLRLLRRRTAVTVAVDASDNKNKEILRKKRFILKIVIKII
jgi:hypothetical protein